ncbi:MAG: RNA methyltransferase [Acidimicrobiia bacterium]|nr:RNA methyltransferase [Acidimicrobiia bacterium]
MIEGPRLLAEALDARVRLVEVFAEEGAALDPRVQATPVAPGALDRSGDVGTSQGVLAVAEAPPLALEAVGELASAPLVLVVVDVADPGNLGTMLRAADAVGCDLVIVAGSGVDVLAPKVVRASAGALWRVPLAEAPVADVLDWLDSRGIVALGAVPHGGRPMGEAGLGGAVALLLGNEARGLAPGVSARLGGAVSIPMPGRAESLNVAMAATVLLFEALRQRSA